MNVQIYRKSLDRWDSELLFSQQIVEGDFLDLSRFQRVGNSLHAHIGNFTMIVHPGEKIIIEHDGPAEPQPIEEKEEDML